MLIRTVNEAECMKPCTIIDVPTTKIIIIVNFSLIFHLLSWCEGETRKAGSQYISSTIILKRPLCYVFLTLGIATWHHLFLHDYKCWIKYHYKCYTILWNGSLLVDKRFKHVAGKASIYVTVWCLLHVFMYIRNTLTQFMLH